LLTKSFLLFFFLVSTSMSLSAQSTISINGLVTDSIGNPVAASLTVITENGAGIAFTKTNMQGFFECKFQKSTEKRSIKITALGYFQLILPLMQNSAGSTTFRLKKIPNQLKEVVIKSSSKIQLSSDTLKYNVNAFKEGNDRVIADLISNLPGIQVDDKGAISYNGKPISNVYIDGDNILEGKYKIGTNNIPVDAVEQVQVIERDQPIKALNGYVIANNVSLNLKLTDQAHTMTLNTGYVGAGNKAYTAELNNLIFQKKIKGINNLKANDIGQNLEREHANVGVSFNTDEVRLKNALPYLSISSGASPALDEKYHLMNNDNAGNINTLFKFKTDWSLRLNISSLQLKRKYNYNNAIRYFLPNQDTISYDEVQKNVYHLNQWQIQTQIEKNSRSLYLKSITKLDVPKWGRKGNTIQNGENLTQNQPTHDISLSNETSIVKALGMDHILQYNSIIQYYKKKESLKIFPGIQENLLNDSTGYLMLNQQVQSKNIFVNQSATYKTKFNQFVISTSIGTSFQRNRLNSQLYTTDSAQIRSAAGQQFQNNVIFDQLATFGKAAVIYLIPNGSINFETCPTYNFINYHNAQDPTFSNKNNYFRLNPTVEFRKNMGRYSEFNVRYSGQTEFGQINDIYPGTILVNYRQLNFNESPLPKTDINSFRIRYAYRRPLKMVFYNINFNYEKARQNYINSYTIDQGITKSIAIDFRNKSDNYTLNGGISKYLFFLSTNISANGNLSLQKGYSMYNHEISPFDTYQMSLSITLRKKVFNNSSFSIAAESGKFINQQKTTLDAVIENTSHVDQIKSEWQHQISPEISYQLIYNFRSYRQSLQQTINSNFLDLNVKYAPSKWKSFFEVQCINLINQDSYQQINLSSNQLSIFQVPLRTRTLVLKYSFSF
jgi:hypothetical protein